MITPLQYDQFNRETWGDFDSAVIATLAAMAYDPCYKPKLYKAPDSTSELVAAGGYVQFNLFVTPGSLIYGFYQNNQSGYLVQLTSLPLDYKVFAQPIPVALLANPYKSSGFPNFFCRPLPSVGSGEHLVEIWNNSASQQRIQVVLGAFEAVG